MRPWRLQRILGEGGDIEALRIERQPWEGLLPGLWLEDTAQQEAAHEQISSWMGRLFSRQFRHQLIRDALRFIHGRHGWGWRYLNKYTSTGNPTLVLNHYEQVLVLVSRIQNSYGTTH